MKKFVILGVICSFLFGGDAFSARVSASGTGGRGGVSAPSNSATNASDAILRIEKNSGPGSSTQKSKPSGSTSARMAVTRGRGASATTVQSTSAPATTKKVNARAATTQKVVSSGTSIASATTNTVVSEECRTKYYGCMDSFCMLDNTNGGRCLCSDKNAEFDEILAQIQKLDEQSYAMATTGVERVNMGDSADEVNAMVKNVSDSITKSDAEANRNKARKLDLSAWNNVVFEEDDLFGGMSVDDITKKTGNELQAAVTDICVSQIPECASSMSMLKMMYAQQIRSDCNAYENSLKQQKNESAKKLQAAQAALREAALEQYQNANKYDLGQCMTHFKQCMQTTAGCGEDFANCASVAASDIIQSIDSKNSKIKGYTIKGATTNISIAASTYDTLMAKKPMCDNVTKQCVRVKDKVWDAFLREVAPELKSAELIAESNIRMSCISNISNCIQKACKDNIDPNDPDGSYDLCLSRPDTVRSLCKIQVEPCEKIDSRIMDYVNATLASMRVDSCTKEVKECLTDENRCGKDYSNCIGLDLESIRNMCPLAKLVGCQEKGKLDTWETIDKIVYSIYTNIDNSLLNTCTNVVKAKMAEICGGDGECKAFDTDNYIGSDSLLSYKRADGSFVIEGMLNFGNVKIKDLSETQKDANNVKFGQYELDIKGYSENISDVDGVSAAKDRVLSTLQSTQNKINQKIALLTSDPKVSMCVYGRDLKQIRNREEKTAARFPHLLDSSIMSIINAGLNKANKNYSEKRDKLIAEALESQSDETKTALCAAMTSDMSSVTCVEKESVDDDVTPVIQEGMCLKYGTSGLQGMQQDSLYDGYDVTMVIDGMKVDNLLNLQSSGHKEYVQTNANGEMVAGITVTSAYSPESNTCTLTTTTTRCENMEKVTTNTTETTDGDYTNILIFSWGDFGGTTTKENYKGHFCTKYSAPVVSTQSIQM